MGVIVKSHTSQEESRLAVFSDCERYRYTLEIIWRKSDPWVQFVGLNPSTADEICDDNTLRRCKSFARDWGFGGMVMTNAFAYRATDPGEMKNQEDPIGFDNDWHLVDVRNRSNCELVVAAWGTHGSHMGRGMEVSALLPGLMCLGKNKDGSPKHPLYLRKDSELIDY